MKQSIKIIIIGAGSRGNVYAYCSQKTDYKVQIAAVAEPIKERRLQMASQYNIPEQFVFSDWKEAAALPKFADAVVIATKDSQHKEQAIAFANKGYHLLLEKPMAVNEQDCKEITDTAIKSKIILAVCHVMRYTKYTRMLKGLIDSGKIGEIVSIQHLEPVGFYHYAHSYVRGNWNNQSESTFMLLAKSCHDIDWLRYIVESEIKSVSSFGGLKHFTKANKPKHAAKRCMQCQCERNCPYSAKKIYLDRALKNEFTWPVDVITSNLTIEGVEKALLSSPYGRCVYECDNNVVDHQVVNMLFGNGVTAAFTMTGFTPKRSGRMTRIFGTRGEIYGDNYIIEVYDFLTGTTTRYDARINIDDPMMSGHRGGDYEIVKAFVEAVANNDKRLILSGPEVSLETHLAVFAAERSRLNMTVENVQE
jgi:predicted dehydrogenase